ncbi:TPA: hypothetical protein PGG59_003824 [Raoultella planticola]|nr:hypothetical protein [Raoultella planticola]
MKSKSALLLPLLSVAALLVGYWIWGDFLKSQRFECNARVYTTLVTNACNKSSAVDVFLSLQEDGKGYLLVSGTHSCENTPLVKLDSVVRFTYYKEGGYYSLHLGPRSPSLIELFDVLRYDDVKLKFTRLDNIEYIVSSPLETLMICTAD